MSKLVYLEALALAKIKDTSLPPMKRCYVCNRLLTDPESVKRGVGPECLEKTGLISEVALTRRAEMDIAFEEAGDE